MSNKLGLLIGTATCGSLLLVAAPDQSLSYLDYQSWPGGQWAADQPVLCSLLIAAYLAKAVEFLLKRKRTLFEENSPNSTPSFIKRIVENRRQ